MLLGSSSAALSQQAQEPELGQGRSAVPW